MSKWHTMARKNYPRAKAMFDSAMAKAKERHRNFSTENLDDDEE